MAETEGGQNIRLRFKVRNILYLIIIMVVVIAGVVAYLLFFVNGFATAAVGNGWYSIRGASAVFSSGKLDMNFVGIESCEFCAAERYAIFDALSNFGNWSYYGGQVTLSSLLVGNYSSNPEPDALFYLASKGDWTLNFLNPHLVYSSNYVNFSGVEASNNQGEPLQSITSYENKYLSKYDPGGGVPFTLIGGNFFEIGAGESLINPSSGRPIIFNSSTNQGFMPQYIISQYNTSGSTINKGITQESNYISAMICKDIGNTAPACSNPAISNLEHSV